MADLKEQRILKLIYPKIYAKQFQIDFLSITFKYFICIVLFQTLRIKKLKQKFKAAFILLIKSQFKKNSIDESNLNKFYIKIKDYISNIG